MHPDIWENEMSNLLSGSLDGSTVKVVIGESSLTCIAALSIRSRQIGLSGSSEIPADGMIFICPTDESFPFTRANMSYDIDIWFFDNAGVPVKGNWSGDLAQPEAEYRYVIESRPNNLLKGNMTSISLV